MVSSSPSRSRVWQLFFYIFLLFKNHIKTLHLYCITNHFHYFSLTNNLSSLLTISCDIMAPGVSTFTPVQESGIARRVQCTAACASGLRRGQRCTAPSIFKFGVQSNFCGRHYVPPDEHRCVCENSQHNGRCNSERVTHLDRAWLLRRIARVLGCSHS